MSDYRSYLFCVADLPIRVSFSTKDANGIHLLPSFSPFAAFSVEGELFIDLVVDDSLQPVDKSHRERIRVCDTGNGDTIVDQTDDFPGTLLQDQSFVGDGQIAFVALKKLYAKLILQCL